jgi:hypothetical protein
MRSFIPKPKVSVRIDDDELFKVATDWLLDEIPGSELDRVLNQKNCDIDPSFLGFVNHYYLLARLIPLSFTVIDFGCAYNPQSYFFKNHKKFIGVDHGDLERFCPGNCEIKQASIIPFIEEHLKNFHQGTTFAICNFVPNWEGENGKKVRQSFENVYNFYPCSLPTTQ